MSRPSAPLILLVLWLGGCAAVGAPRPTTTLRVDPAPPIAAAAANPLRLSLAPVTASGADAGRRYVYVQASAPGEVRQAATLFWEEPPAAMVERALLRGLGARLGAPVLPTAVAAGEAQVLRVSLDRFEERDGGDQAAVVALNAVALDAATRTPVFARRYCGTAAIGGAARSSRSAAFEIALTQVMDALAVDLVHGRPTAVQAAC